MAHSQIYEEKIIDMQEIHEIKMLEMLQKKLSEAEESSTPKCILLLYIASHAELSTSPLATTSLSQHLLTLISSSSILRL